MNANRRVHEATSRPVGATGGAPPTDAEIRRRVIDRVIDLGGEVCAAACERGAVRLRGRVGLRSDRARAQQAICALDGVNRLDSGFAYLVDDRLESVHG